MRSQWSQHNLHKLSKMLISVLRLLHLMKNDAIKYYNLKNKLEILILQII